MVFSNKNSCEASSSGQMLHNLNLDDPMIQQSNLPTSQALGSNIQLMQHFLRQEQLMGNHPADFILLGSFKCLLHVQYPPLPQCFLSSVFKYAPPHEFWPPTLSNQHKADLDQAHYSLKDIMELNSHWASLCSKCLQWGHKKLVATHA